MRGDDWVDLMFKTFSSLVVVGMAASLVAIAVIILRKAIE